MYNMLVLAHPVNIRVK